MSAPEGATGHGPAEAAAVDELAFDVADLPGGAAAALEAVLMVADEPVPAVQLATVLGLPDAVTPLLRIHKRATCLATGRSEPPGVSPAASA